jgi:hypothetical protein
MHSAAWKSLIAVLQVSDKDISALPLVLLLAWIKLRYNFRVRLCVTIYVIHIQHPGARGLIYIRARCRGKISVMRRC